MLHRALTKKFIPSPATVKVSEDWRVPNVISCLRSNINIPQETRIVSLPAVVVKLLERVLQDSLG